MLEDIRTTILIHSFAGLAQEQGLTRFLAAP